LANRSGLKRLALAAVTVAILIVLARAVDWRELKSAFAGAQWEPLVAAALLTLLFPVLNTFRWLAVLRAAGARMSWMRAFRITMACWPVGTLTPGKAGELLKATALRDRALGLGTVLAERLVDVAVLGCFGAIFGLVAGSAIASLIGVAAVCAVIGFVLMAGVAARMLSAKPIGAKIAGFLELFPRLARQPGLLMACVLSSALNWFLSMAQLWFLLEAFGAPASLVLIMGILPAATFAGLIPITIAGAGTRDGALILLAGGLIDSAPLLAASVVYTFLGYFLLGIAGLPFLGELTKGKRGH